MSSGSAGRSSVTVSQASTETGTMISSLTWTGRSQGDSVRASVSTRLVDSPTISDSAVTRHHSQRSTSTRPRPAPRAKTNSQAPLIEVSCEATTPATTVSPTTAMRETVT